ncbi:MAG: ABC transporter ATP-binding protein [Leptolyngbyaceae cyanobacterium]
MGTATAIRTQSLTKRFDRALALRSVDLEIEAGAIYGLIGPNGAGKTTLLRLLAMAESPTVGEIYLNGEKLDSRHPNPRLQRQIGYLPDDFPLYEDLTVWDYLDYFARLYHLQGKARINSIHDVLELVNLPHKRHSLITQLSRGMKQRLGLARTVIHTPTVLLLDEPVSGLDPIARQDFRQAIRNLQGLGITVVISSHVLSDLAELCTAVGILEFGYLVENTSLASLYQKLGQQKLVMGTRGSVAALQAALEPFKTITDIQADPASGQIQAQFSGDADQAAEVLRSLVEARIPLYDFHCTQDSLEEIFVKIGHTQPT